MARHIYPLYTTRPGETYTVRAVEGSGINKGRVIVTSVGTVTQGGATVSRTVRAVLKVSRENICVWNNVIFGGVGQAGRSIQGNVRIRGSVHLLGDGEPFTDLDGDKNWDVNEPYADSNGNGQYDLGEPYLDVDGDGHRDTQEPFFDSNGNGTRDPALTVTDMASEILGTADMTGNYDGMPIDLRSRVPALETVAFGGEMVESLNAKMRVKHGKVNISGMASVGFPNVSGNLVKETVDGTYVSDGFGGAAGTASVHSDNGYSHGYDLGDGLVDMPLLDYGTFTAPDGMVYPTYMDYLKAHATPVWGNLTLTQGVATTIIGPQGKLEMDAAGNMKIEGIVYVNGDVIFNPSKGRITYEGSGTLVSTGSMFVHCDVLPKTNFPKTDVLGLIARDRIELATGMGDAQLKMAMAMYAQHKIVSVKQNEIAGTMVSSFYQMANVPAIYQVPELANNLPPGMPGSEPIWIISISTESWSEKL